MREDEKSVRDEAPRYSQRQLDEATKPLHAERDRLETALAEATAPQPSPRLTALFALVEDLRDMMPELSVCSGLSCATGAIRQRLAADAAALAEARAETQRLRTWLESSERALRSKVAENIRQRDIARGLSGPESERGRRHDVVAVAFRMCASRSLLARPR